jgi:hypothetical protein
VTDNLQIPNDLESEGKPAEQQEIVLATPSLLDVARAEGILPVKQLSDAERGDLHDWETADYGDRDEDYCPYCHELNDLCGEVNNCRRDEGDNTEESLVERILREAVGHDWLESLFIGNDRFDTPSMEAGIVELAGILDVVDNDAFRQAVREAWAKLRQSASPSAYERMIIRYAVKAYGWLFTRHQWQMVVTSAALADKIKTSLSQRQGHNVEVVRVLRLYPELKLTRGEND